MIAFLLAVHVLLCEIAAFVLKIGTVEGQYFGEEASLDLLLQLIYTISIYECASPGCMCMQIQKCKESVAAT